MKKQNKLAQAVKGIAEYSVKNAVNKKYIIMLHEPTVPAKVREAVENKKN